MTRIFQWESSAAACHGISLLGFACFPASPTGFASHWLLLYSLTSFNSLLTSKGYSFCTALLTIMGFPLVIILNWTPLTMPSLPTICSTTFPIFQLDLFTLSSCTKTTLPIPCFGSPSYLDDTISSRSGIPFTIGSKSKFSTWRDTWTL